MLKEEIGQSQTTLLNLRVGSVKAEAKEIVSLELVAPGEGELPPFAAGSHIDVHLPGGIIRQYSLCNLPSERRRYAIGVLREAQSRGGSTAMHTLKAGDDVFVSHPRNNFPLAGYEANFHLLLAGGIGVTPMLAMVAELEKRKADYFLHYCAKSKEHAAFLSRIRPLVKKGKAELHFDGGDPSKGLDIAKTLAEPAPATHVYVCGPRGFMNAAKAAVEHWAPHTVHFEHFTASPLTAEEAAWDEVPFEIEIKSTGKRIPVPAHVSIVECLRANDIEVETSCEDGYCGTCITRYVAGDPVHRDTVLSEGDRKNYVMVCRARSRSPVLVVDV